MNVLPNDEINRGNITGFGLDYWKEYQKQ